MAIQMAFNPIVSPFNMAPFSKANAQLGEIISFEFPFLIFTEGDSC
jgi:hypothetical protein